MSIKYKSGEEVPSNILADRLDELSKVISKGHDAPFSNEFTMRIPAECDRDADIVLSAAAQRIRDLEAKMAVAVAANWRG